MKKDHEFVQAYLGMEKPYDVQIAFTTRMLDTSIKMDAGKAER
jgi:NitT/TauT family transport system substrate-binding protein